MTEQGTAPATGAETPAGEGAKPDQPTSATPEPVRDAGTGGDPDAEQDARDAQLASEEVLRALRSERRRNRELERETKAFRDAAKAAEDAGKSDMQRVTEERDALLARVSEMERAKQAVDVATEFGVHEWADELAKDEDTRAMRAHAQRIRDRLGRTSPGMDGGVRGMGVPPSPQGMDDMIRAGVRRQ